jgi:predicted dinucleotide-binding enzyme
VGDTFAGSSVVKAFDMLPAKVSEAEPAEGKSRRVIFVSGDHFEACKVVASLIEWIFSLFISENLPRAVAFKNLEDR